LVVETCGLVRALVGTTRQEVIIKDNILVRILFYFIGGGLVVETCGLARALVGDHAPAEIYDKLHLILVI
jgi:hypothetical protein